MNTYYIFPKYLPDPQSSLSLFYFSGSLFKIKHKRMMFIQPVYDHYRWHQLLIYKLYVHILVCSNVYTGNISLLYKEILHQILVGCLTFPNTFIFHWLFLNMGNNICHFLNFCLRPIKKSANYRFVYLLRLILLVQRYCGR